ncbi:MAG TPA: DUF512 domain-containing protein [Firmicutes bacterium]|nr:DUF512 domain-containing protein [Bacillota bacterium]
MAIISGIKPGSIAEEAGLVPGDELLSINGHNLRDVIDYLHLSAGESLVMEVSKKDSGDILEVEVEKDPAEELGLVFAEAVFDGKRFCENHCFFCFVDHNPQGLRSTLYERDDDYRLSFLSGHYITLTNLTDEDWRRIVELKLSPLYVSVHTTNPDLRARMLGNREARLIGEQLRFLAEHDITVHAQIVLCPGVNDGSELERTLSDLASYFPAVASVSVVPVGLTKYTKKGEVGESGEGSGGSSGGSSGEGSDARPHPLRPYRPEEAQHLVREIETRQAACLARLGTRFVWPADEFYFLSGADVPPHAVYEDYPQLDNGVGLTRRFRREFRQAWREAQAAAADAALLPRRREAFSLATGVLGYQALKPLLSVVKAHVPDLYVYAVPNTFFGETVTVSGLLTGTDLLTYLRGRPLGKALVIPGVMLRSSGDEAHFLDGLSPADVQAELGVPLVALHSAADLVTFLWEQVTCRGIC